MTDDSGPGDEGQQLHLPIVNSSAPPATRAECAGIARPCNRYSCAHHLWPELERAGRPHHGTHPDPDGVSSRIAVQDGDSCALDVAERGRSKTGHVGKQLGVTAERVRQLEDRAMRKVGVALKLEATLEQLRAEMGGAVQIETAYPRTNDPNRVTVVVVVMKVEDGSQPVIRRRRG